MTKKILSKRVIALSMATVMAIGSVTTAFAGEWKKDNIGWWWQNDDGSYAKSEWKWLDGNKDGVSECYCFNASGYMFANTTTPDGYTVNADGQWTENGVVKTKQTGVQSTAGQNRQYGTPDEKGCYRTDEYDPETGISMAALDMLRNNSREANAKYGEIPEQSVETLDWIGIDYQNGLYVEYIKRSDEIRELDPEWYAATNGTISYLFCSSENISKGFDYGSDKLTKKEKYEILKSKGFDAELSKVDPCTWGTITRSDGTEVYIQDNVGLTISMHQK